MDLLQIPMAKHVVYKKDGAGNTYKVGESVYQGRILPHPPEFSSAGDIVKQIQELPVRKDDLWLLDYSKSGTHWMVSILSLLRTNEMGSVITSKHQGMVEMCTNLTELEKMSSPRVLNTHMRLDLIPNRLLEQNKVIMMLRNPKSVAVSMYRHTKNLPFYDYHGSFKDYLPIFIEGSYPELYGNWFEYVTEFWKAFKDKPNMLFVVYEEMKKEPVKVIKEVSEFLGLDHDIGFIEKVAEQTSMDSLKAKQKDMEARFTPFVDAIFRKGTTTDWKSHFTVAQNEMFDAVYEEKMKDYPDLKQKIRFS